MSNTQPEQEQSNERQPSEQELRDLGSAEIGAMTFTPPGQAPMTLDESHAYNLSEAAEREENLRIMAESMEQESRERGEAG